MRCHAKRQAEDAAYEARGVKQVHNQLRIGGHEHSSQGASSNGARTSSTGTSPSDKTNEARRA